ncbi:MAG: ABC transporter permease [Myxococcota bacterium]
MGRIYAVALNTYREAVRDRVLHGVLGCALVVLALALALAELSLDQQGRVIFNIGRGSISFFAVIMATFLGSSLLHKEIERKTLYVILSRPIRRWEFLLGKYLGIVLTTTVFVLVMGGAQFAVMAIQAGAPLLLVLGVVSALCIVLGLALWKSRDATVAVVPWAIGFLLFFALVGAGFDVEVELLGASLLLIVFEIAVLTSVALLFSSFSTPFLTGIFTLGIWLVGRDADDMANMPSRTLGPEIKAVLRVLSEIIPNFNLFFPHRQAFQSGSGFAWGYVAETAGYGTIYTALILGVAILIFRRRDFL